MTAYIPGSGSSAITSRPAAASAAAVTPTPAPISRTALRGGSSSIRNRAASSAWPQTVPINNDQGYRVGTATISGNRVVLRWNDGTLIGTVVEEKGTRAFYDPSGKITDQPAWDRVVAAQPDLADDIEPAVAAELLEEARALLAGYYRLEDPTRFDPEWC